MLNLYTRFGLEKWTRKWTKISFTINVFFFLFYRRPFFFVKQTRFGVSVFSPFTCFWLRARFDELICCIYLIYFLDFLCFLSHPQLFSREIQFVWKGMSTHTMESFDFYNKEVKGGAFCVYFFYIFFMLSIFFILPVFFYFRTVNINWIYRNSINLSQGE